jgi:hypothetical protein
MKTPLSGVRICRRRRATLPVSKKGRPPLEGRGNLSAFHDPPATISLRSELLDFRLNPRISHQAGSRVMRLRRLSGVSLFFRSLTPGPPPFSAMNSTPAVS